MYLQLPEVILSESLHCSWLINGCSTWALLEYCPAAVQKEFLPGSVAMATVAVTHPVLVVLVPRHEIDVEILKIRVHTCTDRFHCWWLLCFFSQI
jgi:hypothetical protein